MEATQHSLFTTRIPTSRGRIAEFCHRWQIAELALFGSILRQDWKPESDVDVLVTFAPGARHGLFDLARMREELKDIFSREVDLVSRRGIESSRNHFRREAILSSAEVLYAA